MIFHLHTNTSNVIVKGLLLLVSVVLVKFRYTNCRLFEQLTTLEPAVTKSWFSFRTSSRPLEVHTDRRQALAKGEVEGGSASTTCAIANQIVSNVPAVLSQNFCSTEYLLLFRSCHCSMVVLGWLPQ
jgi:hypothetical protein